MKLLKLNLILLFTVMCGHTVAKDDLIDEVKNWPPTHLRISNVEASLAHFEWKIEQNAVFKDAFKASGERLRNELRQVEKQIKELKDNVPAKAKLVNEETRSRLAGKLVEEQIDATLELETIRETIDGYTSKLEGKAAASVKAELRAAEVELNVAEERLMLERKRHGATKRLFEKKSITETSFLESQLKLTIVEGQMAAARTRIEIIRDQPKAEIAAEISSLTTRKHSVQNRIVAIENILQEFNQAAEIFENINQLKETRRLLSKDLEMVVSKYARLNEESLELRTFSKLIKAKLDEIREDERDKSE